MKKRLFGFSISFLFLTGMLGAVPCHAAGTDFTIGICQLISHESLDASTQGFKDALTEKLGDRVAFLEQNAHGDIAACSSVVNDLIAKDVDLILANSTTSLQVAATATTEIPILGTSVTDYPEALLLDEFDGTVGGNISGTSDLAPFPDQADLIHELFPDAHRIGMLYCSAEPNSQYQVTRMTEELTAMDYECAPYAFSDSNDISPVAMTAVSECDLIYIPTDNTAASNAELIANICLPESMPVVTGDESTCLACGVASLSISYYDLGYTTGEMAARILLGEETISAMPVEYASSFTKKYNKNICQKLGIEVPADYTALKEE